MTSRSVCLGILLAAGALGACGPAGEGGDEQDEVIVSEGKEDNFYSSDAAEFWVSGTAKVVIEATYGSRTEAAKLARAQALAPLKNLQVSWFLNQYVKEKESSDSNSSYGGFEALVRFDSEEAGAMTKVDAVTYSYPYRVQIAGSPRLLENLPGPRTPAGTKTVTLAMAKVPNDRLDDLVFNSEWYRSAPYSAWNPTDKTEDELEKIDLSFEKQKMSSDAYLPYDRLFADGEVSIGVHFGHDYHARYDIGNSRALYNTLITRGFASPVSRYEDLLRTSAPLTKTVRSSGKDIVVKVAIFHPGDAANNVPGPDPDTDDGGRVLEADMRESFKSREIIIFAGHSGPLYGFALANWKKTEEGDLDDSKIAGLEMPADKFQLVLANGCDTYAMGQAFWKNPAKADKKNLNVVTSTSFSNAASNDQVIALIDALSKPTSGKMVAQKASQLIEKFGQVRGFFNTMYGMHGLDANPKFDPLSDASKLCQRCTSNAACGADGNRCTSIKTGLRACTFACIDDTGCPTSYACRPIVSTANGTILTKQCVPRSLSCN